jgi:hypothetical protein
MPFAATRTHLLSEAGCNCCTEHNYTQMIVKGIYSYYVAVKACDQHPWQRAHL